MSVTVGHMKQTNPHVSRMPNMMLKPHETEISKTQLRVHSAVQGAFYAGIPASTAPALVKNPTLYGIGMALGAPLGALYRIVTETTCPSKTPYLKDWKNWMEHSAAMNNTSKVVMAVLNSAGISGNVLANVFLNETVMVLSQGAVVGAIASYEVAGMARHLFCPVDEDQPESPSETEPLHPV